MIKLTKAKSVDCHDLWMWRNSPVARQGSFIKRKIRYEDHQDWFSKKIKDKNTVIYIAKELNGRKVGQIRFEIRENKRTATVNVNLDPFFVGRGFGTALIMKGSQKFLNARKSIKEILANVLEGNMASKKAFLKAGYVMVEKIPKNNKNVLILEYKLK